MRLSGKPPGRDALAPPQVFGVQFETRAPACAGTIDPPVARFDTGAIVAPGKLPTESNRSDF